MFTNRPIFSNCVVVALMLLGADAQAGDRNLRTNLGTLQRVEGEPEMTQHLLTSTARQLGSKKKEKHSDKSDHGSDTHNYHDYDHDHDLDYNYDYDHDYDHDQYHYNYDPDHDHDNDKPITTPKKGGKAST